jgi:hypothetical protein
MKKPAISIIILLSLVHFSLFLPAQTHFGPQTLLNPVSMSNPVEHQWADLDGDGDDDCLVVSHWDDTISWFENLGEGEFGPQRIITRRSGRAEAIWAADLDGDEDIDVLTGERSTEKVQWFMNLDGRGNFSEPLAISYDMPVDDILAADMDLDGLEDVVAAFGSTISWFKNLGTGQFSEAQIITEFTVSFIRSIKADDLNQDGLPDILFCASDSHLVGWIENPGEDNRFSPVKEISTSINYPMDVFAADLDGDGDADVLSASQLDNEINWFENLDGTGHFSPKNTLTNIANNAVSVWADDMDLDGDLDVLSAGFFQVIYYENLDGTGQFGQPQYVTAIAEGARSVKASDIDRDGFPDITAAYSQGDRLVWFPKHPEQPGFGEKLIIAQTTGNFARDCFAGPILSGMRADVLAAFSGDNTIVLYHFDQNRADQPTVTVLDDQVNYPYSVWADDLNGDGLEDVLYASLYDASLRWKPNMGGSNFGDRLLISDQLDFRSRIRTIDFDQDGDQDLIFSHGLAGDLAISPNLDGAGTFGDPIVFDQLPSFISTYILADQNRDGLREILVLTQGNRIIQALDPYQDPALAQPNVVFENDEPIHTLASVDTDLDGFEEIVFTTDVRMVVVENTGGLYGDTSHLAVPVYGIVSFDPADLDLDGDPDLVVCSTVDDKVYWFENTGDFLQLTDPIPLDGSTVVPVSVLTADLDSDDFPDILSASSWDDKIAWYRNRQLLTITQQPEDQEICEFENSRFRVETDREAQYQWQIKRFSDPFFRDIPDEPPFSGTQSTELQIDSAGYAHFHWSHFRCKIFYSDDSLFSEAANLQIVPTLHAIAGFDQYLCDSLGILLEAHDPWPGTGKWTCPDPEVLLIDPVNAVTPVMGLPFGTTPFYWEVNHDLCPGASDTVFITLYQPLEILNQPYNQALVLGETARFEVENSGEVFQYQWMKNEVPLANDAQTHGVNGPLLTIQEITEENEGTYACWLFGRCDTLLTDNAHLSITTALERIQSADIWIGPNPIRQPAELIFHIPGIQPEDIICYDEKGRNIETFKLVRTIDDNYQWSIHSMVPGMYYLLFRNRKEPIVKKLYIVK